MNNFFCFQFVNDGVSYVYNPKSDIASYELSLLLPVFSALSLSPFKVDFVLNMLAYLTENDLLRHFDVTP